MTNYIIPYKLFVGSFTANWLMRRTELSQGAKLCYARLCQFSGENGACYPSQETLAYELGVKARNVRKYLKELEAVRLIETIRSGKTKPNRYLFPEHEWMELRNKKQNLDDGDRHNSTGQKDSDRHDSAGQKGSDRHNSTARDRHDSAYEENQLRESTTTKREKNVVVVSSVLERIPEEHRETLEPIIRAKLEAGKEPESVILNALYSIAHNPKDLVVYTGRSVDFRYAESAGWTPDKARKKQTPEVNHEQIQAKVEAEQEELRKQAEEREKERKRFLSLPDSERERLREEFFKIAHPFEIKRLKKRPAHEFYKSPAFLEFLKSA